MKVLQLFSYDPDVPLDFDKCLGLESLDIDFRWRAPLVKITTLFAMVNLSNLKFFGTTLTAESLAAFDRLFALRKLELDHCSIRCDWFQLGRTLSQTPLKSLSLRRIDCSVEDIEAFLHFVNLDYLFFCFPVSSMRGSHYSKLFEAFASSFSTARKNPRSFLI
jgi:hypothetical protein